MIMASDRCREQRTTDQLLKASFSFLFLRQFPNSFVFSFFFFCELTFHGKSNFVFRSRNSKTGLFQQYCVSQLLGLIF